jgi:hypothetical protein
MTRRTEILSRARASILADYHNAMTTACGDAAEDDPASAGAIYTCIYINIYVERERDDEYYVEYYIEDYIDYCVYCALYALLCD